MNASRFLISLLFVLLSSVQASEVFVEAESFKSSGGWVVMTGPSAREASGLAVLNGAGGAKDGVAATTVSIKDAGRYRIWVRYGSHPKWRGPFHLTALAGGRVLGDGLFDAEFEGKSARDSQAWGSFEADLPEGEVTLRLSKHENKNCSGYARWVDCVLLTMDSKLVPNHLHYGAQTYLRVTLGDGYEKPAYIHVFSDHFHAPWYQHYSLARAGAGAGIAPKKPDMLKSGESTPWCNITPMIYQDSGAMLHITVRHAYTDYAERLRAAFEFATAPNEKAVVRTLKLDNKPGTVAIYMPPNLLTPENLALLKTDREIAEATGKIADAYPWPTHGKPLEKFPFFVTAAVESKFTPRDAAVLAREQKTLRYFGFTPGHLRQIGGAWLMKNGSFCSPDTEKMRERFRRAAVEFKKDGGRARDIVFCELTDEPTGQPLDFAAKDPSYAERFRAWLRAMGRTPANLLVKDWDAVRIVTGEQRDEFPALYYFSQRFRTRALGDFMAAQGTLAQEAYGGMFPVLANFSDGAVYTANFCAQGVDYFELLDAPDQNAIWGEDWSNGASTYQCASFNVDLMRAAARERGQVIGHHLVAHAGRKPWDIKLKATSEVARGVKILNNFCYGPSWATHEGGPYWRAHVWQAKPETWTANAALTREIGAVEDMLLTAMPAPARVALLYSSASDVWTVHGNLAHGFDRMHTWLALSHAQMPVDVVSERQVEKNLLAGYRVCYLTGPNLTAAAAGKLKQWVQKGGTLWLTAGAASHDEFNRPLNVLDEILPVKRGDVAELQKYQSSGRYLHLLVAKDEVRWEGGKAAVLAVKQSLTAQAGAATLATFKDNTAAIVRGTAGKGTVYCCGFLPALAYIKAALDHRNALQKKLDDKTALSAPEQAETMLLERSYNPGKFPADVRDLILMPARDAKIARPIQCSRALVDAVFMPHDEGILIPLANYTLEPIAKLTLRVSVPRPIVKAESATLGEIAFKQTSPQTVELSLPLENNDFVKLRFR
ncbi:MAG: beta-galactosidase trimerization domain-containing protein [Verrucomicrobia bacterium]|nr:beta-galactosidase trimerization domain-containing protein [Verrucomicrobiota bacterium]